MSEKFIIRMPEREAVVITRDQLNSYSSAFNTAQEVAPVGSEDFIEALADYLFEEVEDTDFLEQVEPTVLMSWVEVVE